MKKITMASVTLNVGRSYGVSGFKFLRGETQVVDNPELIQRLINTAGFSVSPIQVQDDEDADPTADPPEKVIRRVRAQGKARKGEDVAPQETTTGTDEDPQV